MPRARAVGALVCAAVACAVAAGCGPSGGGSGGAGTGGAGPLRVSGSTTVNPVAADAAQALRGEGLEVTVDAAGGSAGGIAQLARGQVDIAMSSKPLVEADRQAHPGVDFVATEIGRDAVGIVVRQEVFQGGVTSLTRAQARALFEGRTRNWREVGGPDLAVFVYDKEPGRGTREVLDRYLYGDAAPPPPPRADGYAVVGGNEEARTKLLSTPGSVGPLSTTFVRDQPGLVALALDGAAPTASNVRDGSYPLARPLLLVTDGPPRGRAATFVDYVLSEAGQALVRRHGYLAVADLGTP